jgi:hypothetical protein
MEIGDPTSPDRCSTPISRASSSAMDQSVLVIQYTTLGVPCTQGSVPVIGVDARSVGDIQAAVKFAVKHNLRLVVKNTG